MQAAERQKKQEIWCFVVFTFLGQSKIDFSMDALLATFTEDVVALPFHHSMWFFSCFPVKKVNGEIYILFFKRKEQVNESSCIVLQKSKGSKAKGIEKQEEERRVGKRIHIEQRKGDQNNGV